MWPVSGLLKLHSTFQAKECNKVPFPVSHGTSSASRVTPVPNITQPGIYAHEPPPPEMHNVIIFYPKVSLYPSRTNKKLRHQRYTWMSTLQN